MHVVASSNLTSPKLDSSFACASPLCSNLNSSFLKYKSKRIFSPAFSEKFILRLCKGLDLKCDAKKLDNFSLNIPHFESALFLPSGKSYNYKKNSFKAYGWRWDDEEPLAVGSGASFNEGVDLFNQGEYYKCHDVLEEAWNNAHDPQRSIIHGVLQCSVGMYHLLNQNHKGAMIELGEGVSKLKRVCNQVGPLESFEKSMSLLLEFIYNTQIEFAACAEDMCITMDGSEQSYTLLGNYGAGQPLYKLEKDELNNSFLVFSYAKFTPDTGPDVYGKIEIPILKASEKDLCEYQ